jgi:DNA-binding NarL/FixJ family response regulator
MSSQLPRALVVEDDASWQQILAEILGDCGLEVDLAENIPAAVQLIHALPHRVAVLDLSLGGPDHLNQDGLVVLDAVCRQDPGCASIILTGFATVEFAVTAIQEKGAFTCLRKETFRRAEFRKVVHQALAAAHPALSVAHQALPVDHQALPVAHQALPVAHQALVAYQAKAVVPAGEPPGVKPARRENLLHPGRSPAELNNQEPPHRSPPVKALSGEPALIVEDDAGWRSLLAELLEDAGYQASQSVSYVEALGLLRSQSFRLAVIDLSLASSLEPEANQDGYRLLATTQKAGIPTIIVSGYASPEAIERAYTHYQLFACLEKKAFDRNQFLALAQKARLAAEENSELKYLTAREREVLAQLTLGATNKEIANALTITPNTVKRHLKSLFAKLGVSTRAGASAIASKAGFLNKL